MWLEGFSIALTASNLFYIIAGTAIGLVVGVLPAIGPAFGVALMLPFTFGMDPVSALLFLAAIHATTTYGDSITSIVIKTPGSSVSVPSCWDGYPLTQQGKGGMALGIAAVGSFLGGFLGWLLLVLIAKPVTTLAMEIGAPEYFALGVMALTLISLASKGETLKGLLWALVGLALSFVGGDPVTGLTSRFAFGEVWLEGGIPTVVPMLGLFAIAQVITMLAQGETATTAAAAKDSVLSALREIIKRPLTVIRSGTIGVLVGVLPALGTTLATVTGYLVEQKYSPEKREFGRGSPAGLMAAEVSKGACVVGDLIPSFTLGVPGSITAALLMSALIVHGIDPGPRFLLSGSMPYAVFAGILLTQAALLVAGLSVAKYFARIAVVPTAVLAPMVVALTFLGAYAERNSVFDIGLMLALGLLGWLSERSGYPVVCLLLGLLLGPIVEVNFYRSLGVGFGSYSIFLVRPITVGLLLITLAFMLWPYLAPLFNKSQPSQAAGTAAPAAEAETAGGSTGIEPWLLGTALCVFGLILWESGQYARSAAMFPRLVSGLGLVLVVYRLGWLIKTAATTPGYWHRGRQLAGRVQPWMSMLLLGFYLGATVLIGLPASTVLYFVPVAWLARFRNVRVLAVTSLCTGVLLYVISRGLRIPLPEGILLALVG